MKAYKDKQDVIKDVTDIEAYLQLPKKDTLLWGIVYIHPKYLSMNSVRDFFKDGFETDFNRHFKVKYPIQFFIRDTIPDWWSSFWTPISRTKDKIDYWVFPRQRWLYKKIPNHWADKDFLIMTTIFESVIHFVEEEDAFNVIEWNSDEYHRAAKVKIETIYRWTKMRTQLEKRMERFNGFYRLYEVILFKYDKHFAKETIEISEFLWT